MADKHSSTPALQHSITPFEFATATRIIFGAGSLREAAPLARSFGQRALVVIGKSARAAQQVEPLLSALVAAGVDYHTFSVSGEPTTATVSLGKETARRESCDVVISFGGGSVIDTGKATAALLTNEGNVLDYLEVIGRGRALSKPAAPFIAIPTTAGTGSEVTRNAVLGAPDHRVKVSLRSSLMLPRVALVDPELTYDLPAELTASTGLDALTQLIEPFVSMKANPLTDAICRDGMRRALRALRRAYEHGVDTAARDDMALASLYGGLALANAGLGAVHGFAGPIGGMFNAPHGAVVAALLPHVMAVNERAVRQAGRAPTSAARFDEVRAIVGDVGELCRAMGVKSLRNFGVTREAFGTLIEKAANASSMKSNPVALTAEEMREVLERAF